MRGPRSPFPSIVPPELHVVASIPFFDALGQVLVRGTGALTVPGWQCSGQTDPRPLAQRSRSPSNVATSMATWSDLAHCDLHGLTDHLALHAQDDDPEDLLPRPGESSRIAACSFLGLLMSTPLGEHADALDDVHVAPQTMLCILRGGSARGLAQVLLDRLVDLRAGLSLHDLDLLTTANQASFWFRLSLGRCLTTILPKSVSSLVAAVVRAVPLKFLRVYGRALGRGRRGTRPTDSRRATTA